MRILIAFAIFLQISSCFSADRYWISSTTSNWNNTANWSASSGGSGGASVPTAADHAIFYSNRNGNCNIDINVNIDRLHISGYTGVIDLLGNDLIIASSSSYMQFSSGTIYDSPGTGSINITTSGMVDLTGATFGANLTINAGRIGLSGSVFNGTCDITKTGSGGDNCGGGCIFNDLTRITNNGGGDLNLQTANPDTFNTDVTFTMTNEELRIATSSVGTLFNGNITLENSGSKSIEFGHSGGTSTLANGFTILVGAAGVTGNGIILENFTQEGSTVQNITLGGGGSLPRIYFRDGTTFNGDITVNSPRIYLDGATFNGDATFVKTADGYDASDGGNIFNGITHIENATTSGHFWSLANTEPDTFNNDVTFSGSGNRVLVGHSSVNNVFYGNIVVESAGGDISFGNNGGSCLLDSGNTVAVGPGGFTSGSLIFTNFTQLGNTPQSIIPTGSTRLFFKSGTVFNGDLIATSPRLHLDGATFNGTSTFEKNSSGYDNSSGGNVFNGETTISISLNTGNFMTLTTSSPDTFNNNVTFNAIGRIKIAYTHSNVFNGNITFNSPDNRLIYQENGGEIVLNGTTHQTISTIGSTPEPTLDYVEIDNPNGVTFGTPITIEGTLDFTSGVITTTSSNLLTIEDGATVTGASDNSYVDGPIRKVGNDAFTFPVGNGGNYQAIAISAPASAGDAFTAQYFMTDPSPLYNTNNKDVSIEAVSTNEYWILDRTTGSSNVNVTLAWDSNSGTISAMTDLIVTRWNGSQWVNHGNGSTSGNNSAGSVTSNSAITNFSPFALGSTTINNSLPIDLVSFNAILEENNRVALDWYTLTELNNDYFTVERSVDGKKWEALKMIKGSGNSSSLQHYSTYDNSPYSETTYYRLKQTDFDGKYTYSDITSVNLNQLNKSDLNLYPNPVIDRLTISSDDSKGLEQITVFNSLGKDVSGSIDLITLSENKMIVDLSNLDAGLYYIKTKHSTNKLYKL